MQQKTDQKDNPNIPGPSLISQVSMLYQFYHLCNLSFIYFSLYTNEQALLPLSFIHPINQTLWGSISPHAFILPTDLQLIVLVLKKNQKKTQTSANNMYIYFDILTLLAFLSTFSISLSFLPHHSPLLFTTFCQHCFQFSSSQVHSALV